MAKITRDSLMTLEAYAKARKEFRTRVIQHKEHRRIAVGPHVTLHFEDELTMRYQVQEMLRAERIFEEEGIQEELDTYNALVPDGRNFKATMMIEYPDPEERDTRLKELIGIEDRVWIEIEGAGRAWAIADEDLDRETADKTSSVHFLRFELDEAMAARLRQGAGLTVGVDHAHYRESATVVDAVRKALLQDLG